MSPLRRLGVAGAMFVLFVGACTTERYRRGLDHAGSVSMGRSNKGRVFSGVPLRSRGPGYVVPPTWRTRGNQYGVAELVELVPRIALEVRSQAAGGTLGVADLSPRRGGATRWHRSHQSGRDIDLMFYSVNERGRSLPPPQVEMVHYDDTGRAYLPAHQEQRGYAEPNWEARRFDVRRNWLLLEALLADSGVRVQWIFISTGLKKLLLDYAVEHGRPRWAIQYADVLLHQPGRAPHDDHFHIRIYCPRRDRPFGCEDTGPIWHHEKKTHKYAGLEHFDPPLWRVFNLPVLYMLRG